MPIPPPLLEAGWQPPSTVLPPRDRAAESAAALVAALAGVVAIAAPRAGEAGLLPRLRALLDDALDAAEPAPAVEPGMTELPDIEDADPALERRRLAALMRRQRR
jgi:hypothetical protein